MIHLQGLSDTLNDVDQAMLNGDSLAPPQSKRIATWIDGRQGLPRAYADTFAGFPRKLEQGIRVFTGERIASAFARHILGVETSRILRLLNVKDPP